MKKALIACFIIAIAIVTLTGCSSKNLGGSADSPVNKMSELTSFTTTTPASTAPLKLLSADPNRRYAVITNPSNAAIYLYFTSNSSTITALDGVYVPAGGSFTINPDNLIYGEVWASSTASKQINVSYK